MKVIARDSIDPFAIPLDGLTSAWGYGDGLWIWSSTGWARFQPPIVPLSIVVDPQNSGDILDVENGDARPGDCPGWADRFDRPGRRLPTLYSARGTDASGRVDWSIIQAIIDAMAGRPFDWIMATLDGTTDYTGSPKVPVAIQARGAAQTGGNYDESIILDPTWIGIQSIPAPVPKPTPPPVPQEEEMSGPVAFVGSFNSQQHIFQVRSQATGLEHWWQVGQSWQAPEVLPGTAGKIAAGAPILASATAVPGQLQVWAPLADGSGSYHAWQAAGAATWSSETVT